MTVPSNNFGFRFSAVITVPDDTLIAINCGAEFNFPSYISDDGGLLYIDGVLTINIGGLHAPQWKNGTIDDGIHFFQFDYFQGPYAKVLNVTNAR